MRNVIAARPIQITCIGIGITGMIACGDDDRLRAEDVVLADPGLQSCFDDQLRGPLGAVYADEIEFIRCNFAGIVSLEGIEVFTGLEELDLTFNDGLTYIEPVLSLPSLTVLDVSECGLGPESTEVLSRITMPLDLYINGSNLGDISAYANAVNLTSMYAIASNITSGIAELTTLTNATRLAFNSNPQSPCEDLEILRDSLPDPDVILPREEDIIPGIDCSP